MGWIFRKQSGRLYEFFEKPQFVSCERSIVRFSGQILPDLLHFGNAPLDGKLRHWLFS